MKKRLIADATPGKRPSVLVWGLKDDAEIAGTVRWIKDGAIGIQFGSLRAKEVWALNQMFRDAPIA